MKRRMIAAFLMAGLVAGVANATDYYVSSIHPNRSDSNSGTSPDAPWATFGKVKSAWSSLNAGDTVHLERGSRWEISFSGNYWHMSKGGTAAGGHITLRGDDYGSGAKPIIHRTGGNTGDHKFLIIQASYVTVRDFEFNGGYSVYGLFTSGVQVNASGGNRSNINILNLNLHNLGGNPDTYVCGIWLETLQPTTISDCLIEGNTVSDYAAHGLNHYNTGFLNNITWRNNIVINSFPETERYDTDTPWPVNTAMQIQNGGEGNLVEYNYFEDTTTVMGSVVGFDKYQHATGKSVFRFNVIANSGSHGLTFDMGSDGAPWKVLWDVYGNIIYNSAEAGIRISPYNSFGSGSVLRFYNNTLFNNCTDGIDFEGHPMGEITINNECLNTDLSFVNNLIYHKTHGSSVAWSMATAFNGTCNHSNNLFWHEGGASSEALYDGGTYYTVANAASFESSAQNTDPRFVNTLLLPMAVSSNGATPNGLSIQADSPAIGAAANLGANYVLDIDRDERTVPWDIGADEYTPLGPPDTESPTVPADLNASAVSAAQIDLIWDASSDNTAIGEYRIYRNGTYLATTPDTDYSDNGLNESTTYTYTVLARDAAGNESAQSQPGSATTLSANDMVSTAVWQSKSFEPQSGRFTVEYDTIASGANIDGVTGLSLGNVSDYTDLAVIPRLSTPGRIDVRNGSAYAADVPFDYTAEVIYHFRIEVDIPAHKYSVYVKAGSGNEVLIAQDYAFRNEQATIESLDTLSVIATVGSHQILNFSVSPIAAVIPEAPASLRVVPEI